jgi:hypothetical protein
MSAPFAVSDEAALQALFDSLGSGGVDQQVSGPALPQRRSVNLQAGSQEAGGGSAQRRIKPVGVAAPKQAPASTIQDQSQAEGIMAPIKALDFLGMMGGDQGTGANTARGPLSTQAQTNPLQSGGGAGSQVDASQAGQSTNLGGAKPTTPASGSAPTAGEGGALGGSSAPSASPLGGPQGATPAGAGVTSGSGAAAESGSALSEVGAGFSEAGAAIGEAASAVGTAASSVGSAITGAASAAGGAAAGAASAAGSAVAGAASSAAGAASSGISAIMALF